MHAALISVLRCCAAGLMCAVADKCNYGVPFPIDFDKIFGTWVDYKEFKAAGGKMPSKIKEQINARSGKPK